MAEVKPTRRELVDCARVRGGGNGNGGGGNGDGGIKTFLFLGFCVAKFVPTSDLTEDSLAQTTDNSTKRGEGRERERGRAMVMAHTLFWKSCGFSCTILCCALVILYFALEEKYYLLVGKKNISNYSVRIMPIVSVKVN